MEARVELRAGLLVAELRRAGLRGVEPLVARGTGDHATI